MATISVYRPLQRCHGIKFLLNWILRPNQFLQKFLSCFQFPAADIIWVILNIWPNVVFLLLKGRDMQHVTCWWLPWYKLCSFTRDDKSGYNVRGRSWQHNSCFPHCFPVSGELWAEPSRAGVELELVLSAGCRPVSYSNPCPACTPCSVAQAIAASTTHNFYPLLFYLKLVKIWGLESAVISGNVDANNRKLWKNPV